MKLTVLGNTGPYPKAGGACSGYLLEHGDLKILLDLGNGTLANYRNVGKIEEISAVICTHLHPDHTSDLFVLRYALEFRDKVIPLYAPENPEHEFKRLYYDKAYEVTPIREDLVVTMGDLTITFKEMRHSIQDFAVKITDGKTTFVYTGDTAYCEALEEFCKGIEVLLCDSAFLEDVDSQLHLSLDKAIQVANDAGVRRLILTHFNPEIAPQRYFELGNGRFKGRLSKAEIMSVFSL